MIEDLGRYKILEEIGQGGFAIVYRAHDTELDRPVALKELRSLLLQDRNWVKRFRREARAIARMDHPRIVTVHDVGRAEGRQFIVMRLVDGSGLDELIVTRGRLPWPETVEDGWNLLVRPDREAIAGAVASFRPSGPRRDHYGDGHAAERIAKTIATALAAGDGR